MTIAFNYQKILEEISETVSKYDRSLSDVTLVTVTKHQSLDTIQEVYKAGAKHLGENRVQEALPKIENLPTTIYWHLIGTLQKNKINKVLGKFTLIHSVDSFELAEKISEASLQTNQITDILLQVNTSGEETKHGFSPDLVKRHLEALNRLPGICLQGLMTMAPFEATESEIGNYFARLRRLKEELGKNLEERHAFHHLSMGMSNDYKIAIAEGATLLRIGTAIFS